MKDKYMIGALAGTIGAFIQDIYGYLVKLTGLSDRGFIDFARAVIFYDVTDGIIGLIVASIAHIIWDLFLGILFVHLIDCLSSNYYYIKALLYGIFLWFTIQVSGVLFRIPMFFHIPASAALITLIGAVFYSLGIAFIIKILDRKKAIILDF